MLGMSRFQSSRKVVAKLEINIGEVKRSQSLEECYTPSYPSRLNPQKMPDRISAKLRGAAVLAAGAVAMAAVACKSLTGVPASLSTVADSGIVYAINGAPSGAPTAVHFFTGSRTAADASFFFDVAFDIDGSGNVVLLPQRAVASGLTSTHGVGLQKTTSDYSTVLSAPKSGYRADTALVVGPNQTVLVQVQDPACAVSITGTSIYGKLVVLSVDKVARTLDVQYTGDPNCGFLSFAPGVPKN
jgi:hypothetical protein